MKKILVIIAIIIIVGLGIWYFSSSGTSINTSSENTIDTNTTGTKQIPPLPNINNEEIVDYTIEFDEYSFSPNTIQATPGEKLTIKLTNVGSVVHDFVIDELNINSGRLLSGESKTITITVPQQSNTYEIYCSVGNHRVLGMIGTLAIEQL